MVLALQLHQLTEALLGVRSAVHDRRVTVERAVQHAEDVDASCERVGDRLEDERGGAAPVDADGRTLLRGRRNTLDEQIEHSGRAEVLRGHAARDREDVPACDRLLQRLRNLLRRELLAFEVALHQSLVRLDD